MANEIESISQGNYILATQQEVSHDNSLSGNGTVESPLSVVPGYNETVLWEGDYTPVNDGYIDLSGSLSSYDKVSFVIKGFSSFMPQNYEYTFWSGGDKTVPIVAFGIPGEGGVRINTCKATCNNTFNRLTFTICKQENIIGTSVSTGTFNSVISKVIGINRKA